MDSKREYYELRYLTDILQIHSKHGGVLDDTINPGIESLLCEEYNVPRHQLHPRPLHSPSKCIATTLSSGIR